MLKQCVIDGSWKRKWTDPDTSVYCDTHTSQKLATGVGPVFPGVVTPAGVMKPHYTGTTPAVHLLV
jgi:hypothetical protein